MKQTNFLNVLDSNQTTVTVVPKTAEPSVEELRLEELLKMKKNLDNKIFACIYCNNSSFRTCNHDFEMEELLKEIDKAESDARGK